MQLEEKFQKNEIIDNFHIFRFYLIVELIRFATGQ